MHEHQLRKRMVEIGRLTYERHLLVAMDGNLSTLLPSGDVLCTMAGCHKGFLTDEDLVVVDRQGKVLRGKGRATSEIFMHLACYEERPDVRAVVHAHPPLSVGFTIANVSMARCILPEVVLTLGHVPTVAYETTGTHALADKIRPYVRKHDALLMDRHGALCLGTDLLDAFCKLETMEHTALITKTARDLGGVKDLPAEEAVKLRAMGLKRYGGPPEAVAQADEPGADLPKACLDCSGCACPSPSGLGPDFGLSIARVGDRPPISLRQVIADGMAAANRAVASASAPAPEGSAPALAGSALEDALVAQVVASIKR